MTPRCISGSVPPKDIQDGGGRHLEKSKNLNIFATDWPILTKFGMLMRLDTLHPTRSWTLNDACATSPLCIGCPGRSVQCIIALLQVLRWACLSVCLSACICQNPHNTGVRKFFCLLGLWPCFGRPILWQRRSVIYFRFRGWHHFYIHNGPDVYSYAAT